jgi:hypothetical protein
LLPSFEGPDEPEHILHARAWAEGARISAPEPGGALPWGYQIHQPPLYYALLGGYLAALAPSVPGDDTIVVNRAQNPRFPYLRHDDPAERVPFAGVHRGLRWLRLPSVAAAVLAGAAMLAFARRVVPDGTGRLLFLVLALWVPNFVQPFAVVANDGLSLALTCAALAAFAAFAPWESGSEERTAGAIATGALLALALVTKWTAVLAAATVASSLAMCWIGRRPLGNRARAAAAFGAPLLVVVGGVLVANQLVHADPTRAGWVLVLFPAFQRPAPLGALDLAAGLAPLVPAMFAAETGWQSDEHTVMGHLLFWPWLAGFAAWAAAAMRGGDARPRTLSALPLIALALALATLLATARSWSNVQSRHYLSVWPLLLLPAAWLADAYPGLWRRSGAVFAALAAVGLAVAHGMILSGFADVHASIKSDDFDRDYRTYVEVNVRDPEAAASYLDFGHFDDARVAAAYEDEDFERVVAIVDAAPLTATFSRHGMHLYASSLALVGRPDEALAVFDQLAPVEPEARMLHVDLVESRRSASEAARWRKRYGLR